MENNNEKKIGAINILGMDYDIVSVNCQNMGLSPFNFGKHIPSVCKIQVNDSICKQQLVATIYHEVTHVILEAIGESELNSNEDFVEKLSRAIMQTFNTKDFEKDIFKNVSTNSN